MIILLNIGIYQYLFLPFKVFSQSGLKTTIKCIGNNKSINQKELSEILSINKSTTAKAVKSLLESGYITRKTSLKDKRYYELYLDKKGLDIKSTVDEMLEIYSKGFSEDEYSKTVDSLSRIFENIVQEKTSYKKFI